MVKQSPGSEQSYGFYGVKGWGAVRDAIETSSGAFYGEAVGGDGLEVPFYGSLAYPIKLCEIPHPIAPKLQTFY